MPTSPALSRIRHIAERTNTLDSLTEEVAAHALDNHTPAFWASASHSNQPLWVICYYANKYGSIITAWEVMQREQPNPAHDPEDTAFLDLLLPLNKEAVADLERAYSRLGSFRERGELFFRTERIEDDRYFELDQFDKAEAAMDRNPSLRKAMAALNIVEATKLLDARAA